MGNDTSRSALTAKEYIRYLEVTPNQMSFRSLQKFQKLIILFTSKER